LQALSGIAFAHVRKWEEDLADPTLPEYTIREQYCPQQYTDLLIQSPTEAE
jgi:hypothetical protein